MTKAYLYKISHSALFLAGIAGVFLMCSIRMLNIGTSDVLREVDILLDFDAFRKGIAVFAAIPFAANFANEWKSNTTNSCVLRSSCDRYIAANVVCCFIFAFITVFIGMTLFTFVYTFKLPFTAYDPNPKSRPFGMLIDKGLPVLYTMIRITIFSLSCAMWSITGIALAAIFPDPFVAICTPFIASYLVERMSMQLPPVCNLWYISLSRGPFLNNALLSFIYDVLVFVLLSVFFGLIFAKIVKRRVSNEIV